MSASQRQVKKQIYPQPLRCLYFFFALPQVFRKIRQPDQYSSQAHHVPGFDSAVKHAGNDSGKRQAHNSSDYED